MTHPCKTICAFCGSADGLPEDHYRAARETGRLLAEKEITLVYGGGRTGLMGALADEMMKTGGKVIGIVPKGLESPQLIYTSGLDRLEIVEDILVRKARMNELADAFIALPGGYGTLDELFEVLTWSQIGRHRKALGFLNVGGYYDKLLEWIQRAFADGYIYQEHLDLYVEDSSPAELLQKLTEYTFPDKIERWLVRD